MLHKTCPNNLKKIVRSRVEGVNLIGSNVLVFTRKSFTEVSKYAEGFVPYKHPKPLSSKLRSTLAMISVFSLFITLSYFTFKWLTRVNAAAQNYTWDFTNSGDYIVSDSNLVEVTGGRAELKVRNYTSDANTMALYHFDENTGTDVTDSSSSANAGVVAGGSWATGQLNTAYHFKYAGTGPTSVVTIQDSASLSLNQAMTLEAWTKFDDTFGVETHPERQTVLDKGTYQLYYDPQIGKIVYEIQGGAQTWDQKAGSRDTSFGSEPEINDIANHTWDTNGKPSVQAMVEMGGYIYVGLGNFTNAAVVGPSDAEIWRYSPTTGIWEFFAGDGVGWPNRVYDDVVSLITDGTRLYAGLGSTAGEADVYMYSDGTWTQIGGDGDATLPNGDSWPATTYEAVLSMAVSGSQLFVGLGIGGGDAEVWKCTDVATCRSGTFANGGTGWVKIGGDATGSGGQSWTNAYDHVRSMAISGTNLVVGLGLTAGEAEVWRCANFNTCTATSGWTKVGGDGSGSGGQSWASVQEVVTTMFVDGNALYVGLGNTGNDGEVWYCSDLTTCTPTSGWAVVGNSTHFGAGIEQVWTLTGDATYLYAGLGNGVSATLTANDAEVWRCTRASCDSSWTRLAGDGTVTVTSPLFHQNIPANTHHNVKSLLLSSGNLYIGLQNQNITNTGEVWSCSAADCSNSLERIGGNYIRKSWGYYGMQSVESIGRANGKLYVGTGYTTHDTVGVDGYYGNATVWEYDKNDSTTPWKLIGGQGIHAGWGMVNTNSAPYEAVLSMTNYSGDLYVGLGITEAQRDAEVWKWNDTLVGGTGSWSKIGGDTVNSSWDSGADTHGGVYSLTVHNCSGSTTNYCLFAGLGGSNNDAEVWEYDGSTWTIRGGDSAINWNSNGNHDFIYTLKSYDGHLYAGLGGTSGGEAEVWRWNGTGNGWAKVGGDGVAGSWSIHQTVESLVVFQGELYAGLGYGTGYGDIWKYNGSTWEQIGGDNYYGSWDDITYEMVASLKVYNGMLYAGLGRTAGDGEVWVYDGTSGADRWAPIGGDGEGWANATRERVRSMAIYDGKLWAGTGDTANLDAGVWAFGEDKVLESTTVGQDTDWHHIAASYDGDIMRIFIDGVQDTSLNVNAVLISDTPSKFYIGASAGNIVPGGKRGEFHGAIDEVRVSNIARSISNIIYKPFTEDPQTVTIQTPQFTTGVSRYEGFSHDPSIVGAVTYRISNDNGLTWKYWDGAWSNSADITQSSSASDLNTHLNTLSLAINPTTGVSYGLLWQAILDGDGDEQVTLDDVEISASADDATICTDDFEPDYASGCQNPTPASSFSAQYVSGGTTVASGTWSNSLVPSFTWSGANDDTDGDSIQDANESGVAGYWVYWGDEETDPGCTNDPQSVGTFQVGASYTPTLTVGDSGKTYCLRIRTSDKAGNLSSIFPVIESDSYYLYRLDAEAPTDPELRVTPESISLESISMYIEWNYPGGTPGSDCAISENCSGINTYLLQTGTTNPTDDLFGWQSFGNTISSYTSPAGDIAYKEGVNSIYLKTVDLAGNTSAGTSVSFSYNGETPEAVSDLTSDPVTASDNPSATNSFTFSWDAPANYSSKLALLEYIYTINVPVPEKSGLTDCIADGDCRVTSLTGVEGLMATRQVPLPNIFYVVARDTGNQNYEIVNTQSLEFYVQTPAPGIPRNIDIADVSVKSEESWKIALSWEHPTDAPEEKRYEVFRSTTSGGSFSEVGGTNGAPAYFDVGLEQQTYYYKVRACDNADSCGEFTSVVDMYPTGKFTEAAALSSDPEVTAITTKRATISWVTDRTSDSKIAYGKSSDDYFDSEPSNSTQVSDHEIALTDLSPGTKYYFVAKWTDEDGNTGVSDEVSFSTSPAPTIEDPKIKVVGIDRVTLEYTVKGASKVRIYYGETSAFGGTVEINTSTDSQTYSTIVENLKDGTKYYYKINTFDSEDDEYDGNILTFETLPRPKVTNVRIQQVKGTAQPTVLVVWETNTEVSSIVTYYPASTPAAAKDVVNINLETGRHRMVIEGLLPQTPYSLIVSGRDKAGNEARSDVQTFTTATDTRPPLISNMRVEGTIVNTGGGGDSEKMAQLLISWDTDEAATSQIEFGEGSGTVYSQRTQEDTSYTYNHVVVISNLVPSRVYHLRALSKDTATNEGFSIDTVTITPKATDSALNLVIQNLSQIFGFLNGLGT